MFPLTLDGIERGIDHLVKRSPAIVPPLSDLHPELRDFDHLDDLSL